MGKGRPKKKTEAEYSLRLNNLFIALYENGSNPYTNKQGSIFKNNQRKTGDELIPLLNQIRKKENDCPFLKKSDYQTVIEAYLDQNFNVGYSIRVNQVQFFIAHLGGWKSREVKLSDKLSVIFNDQSDRTEAGVREEFCRDLMSWKYTKDRDNKYCFFRSVDSDNNDSDRNDSVSTDSDSHDPGGKERAGRAFGIARYIIECNYYLISKKCNKKDLLKTVIEEFAKHMSDSKCKRSDYNPENKKPKPDDLYENNVEAVNTLENHLKKLLRQYVESAETEDKDWFLACALSLLIMGAMLRNAMSCELIEKYIANEFANKDSKAETEEGKTPQQSVNIFPDLSTIHNGKEAEVKDLLFYNFRENEDPVYGLDDQILMIERLFNDQWNSEKRSRIVYIQGIGGIGKSTLAKAYAENNKYNYDIIMEVSASSAKDAIILMETSIPEHVQYQAKLQRIASVCRKQKVLLIVHDYNQPQDDTYGDFYKLGCDILLTGWFDRTLLGVKTLQMETNDGSDQAKLSSAAEIFRANYLKNAEVSNNEKWKQKLQQILDDGKDFVLELCMMSGCHPLTIKVLAMQSACISDQEEKPGELVRKLHEQEMEHTPARAFGLSKDGSVHRFGDALTHLESIFTGMLKSSPFSDEEYRCLRSMSLVPYAWGISSARYEEWTGEDADWLGLLAKKGWIEFDRGKSDVLSDNKDTGIYRMPLAISSALSKVEKAVPDCTSCSEFISHFLKMDIDKEIIFLKREALASEAETIVRQLKEESSEEYASIISQCALFLKNMETNVYRRQLQVDIHSKALKIREQILGLNHPDTAASFNSLGICYENMGRLDLGVMYLHVALQIRKKTLGENHPDTAASYTDLGSIYKHFGDRELDDEILWHFYKKQNKGRTISNNDIDKQNKSNEYWVNGMEYMEKALRIRQQILGENHPDTAASFDKIGDYYETIGDWRRGIEFLEKALEIRIRTLGEYHPDTAASYDLLGRWCERIGDPEKEPAYLEKALEIRRRILGEEHADTAASYNKIGDFFENIGNPAKGLEYMEKALKIRQQVLGENHPDTAASYNNLGYSYEKLGNYEKGLEYMTKALKIRQQVLGEEHLDTVVSYFNVGSCYERINEHEKAKSYLEKAREILGRIIDDYNKNRDTSVYGEF